jgi:hypothetical protein
VNHPAAQLTRSFVGTITDVTGSQAIVHDRFGQQYTVRTDVLPGKAAAPEVGETWIIDRPYGYWSFAAFVGTPSGTAEAPVPDNFADAMVLEGAYGTVQVDNSTATVEPTEPARWGDPGYLIDDEGPGLHSLWFKWTATGSGSMSFDTLGSHLVDYTTMDTVLEVFTGSALTALTAVTSDDDTASPLSTVNSAVTLTAIRGTTYYFRVTGYSDSEVGTVFLNWHPDTSGAPPVTPFSVDGTGPNSIAIHHSGDTSTASGSGTIAIGQNAAASGQDAIAIGALSLGQGVSTTALGYGAQAVSDYSTAIGSGAQGRGPQCVAIGIGAYATDNATIIGYGGYAAYNSIGIGCDVFADGNLGVAIGINARAGSGSNNIAIGSGTLTSIGAEANHQGSIAIGSSPAGVVGPQAYSDCTVAIGSGDANRGSHGARANNYYATALGYNTTASGQDSIALGSGASAIGQASVALGLNATTGLSHTGSVALGQSAATTAAQQIMLGNGQHVVVPSPGDLTVGGVLVLPLPAVFSMPGAVAVATSGRWYAYQSVTLNHFVASLGTAGSTGTVVYLMKNGADMISLTLAAGVYTNSTSGVVVAPGDYLQVRVATAGTGAKDLSVQVYFS